jgi:hypothetical protein
MNLMMMTLGCPIGLGDPESDAKAKMDAGTTPDAAAARKARGVAAAGSLIQNGYNPDRPGDNDELVAAIAGGAALTGPQGVAIGAALEILYTGAKALVPVLQKWGLLDTPHCNSSGNWTPSSSRTQVSVIGGGEPDLAGQRGSFTAFGWDVMSRVWADEYNCQSTINPTDAVNAIVAIWNEVHDGPQVGYLVPRLDINGTPGKFSRDFFVPWDSATGAGRMSGGLVVMVNTGAMKNIDDVKKLHLNKRPPVQPTAMSAPAKVAVGTVAVVGAGALGAAVYAFATKQAFGAVLKHAWKQTGGRLFAKAKENPITEAHMLMPGERFVGATGRVWTVDSVTRHKRDVTVRASSGGFTGKWRLHRREIVRLA